MGIVILFSLVVLFQCSIGVLSWGGSNNEDKVLLEKVTAITLVEGELTNGRRSFPVPQLDCVGGAVGCSYKYKPKVVQCQNVGFDGYDVQWECTADLDNDVKFGRIEVTCEGYSNPDDPYILRGSCGLRYELDWTRQGQNNAAWGNTSDQDASVGWFLVVVIIVVMVLIICLCVMCSKGSSSSSGRTTHFAPARSSWSSSSRSRSSGSRSAKGFGGTSRR